MLSALPNNQYSVNTEKRNRNGSHGIRRNASHCISNYDTIWVPLHSSARTEPALACEMKEITRHRRAKTPHRSIRKAGEEMTPQIQRMRGKALRWEDEPLSSITQQRPSLNLGSLTRHSSGWESAKILKIYIASTIFSKTNNDFLFSLNTQ